MFKIFAAFIGVAVLALGGAVVLLVWISSMTPIHVTEESEPTDPPPTALEWVDRGAVLLVIGEVQAVYGAEWSTSDATRPATPWDVSGVPDDSWIHTPMLIELHQEPIVLRPGPMDALNHSVPSTDLLVALRGGEVGEDRYEVIDGQDRDFRPEDEVALLLSVQDRDFVDPELIGTTFGDGWEFLARFQIEDDVAILQWGDETHEQPLDDLIESFRQAQQ